MNERLGLIGVADVVEFLARQQPLPDRIQTHGSRNKKAAIAARDDLRLAGRALCLEEMSGHPVPKVRSSTPALSAAAPSASARPARARGRPLARSAACWLAPHPPPVNDERCLACSAARDLCQPDALTGFVAERRDLFDPDA